MGRIYGLCIVLLCFISNTSATEDTIIPQWGEICPLECLCQIINSSQTLLSRWEQERKQVKSALCVFRNNNLTMFQLIPNDTEAFTFLQASDGPTMFVSGNMLQSLEKVKSIDMQGSLNNATTHITNDIFHKLHDLKYLSLQRIDLTGAEKAFSKVSSLEVLYVTYCTLGYLKWEMLDGLTKLKELYLVQSGIKELYGFAFYGTPELRRLFLSHNDLFSVDADAFVGLLKLEYLDLSNNRIDHLSGLTFPPLPHLQWLELKHNPIKVIFPHCFQFLNGTQHLTIGHKHQAVHLMKFSFRGLYSLKFLHIPNIDNEALSEHMFYDLKSLQHLNLQGRVKIINNRAFNGAHKLLHKLILHDCKLERIYSESFHGLNNLQYLDLSTNLLQHLPDGTFEQLKLLHTLFLHRNKLKSLPDGTFFPLHNLKVVLLHDNAWNCSCAMRFWKAEIITIENTEVNELCTDGLNSSCSESKRLIEENEDLTPKCENPIIYRGESVFHVIKLLGCERLT